MIALFPHNSSRQNFESNEPKTHTQEKRKLFQNYKMLLKDIKGDLNKWTMYHVYGWEESISKWFQFSPVK